MLSVVEIDRENDLAYILLRPELRNQPRAVARSLRVGDDIVLDLDASGQLIGIELLNASARLDLNSISEESGDFIVGVKEAAEMLRLEKPNFIRDHANKPEFPAPLAELASGRFWLRSDVQQYIEKSASSRLSRVPLFKAGDLVALRSDPNVLLPIIEVMPGGAEPRYRVFHNSTRTTFYESQLRPAPVAAEEQRSLSVSELHACLTSLQILSPSTHHLFSLRSGRIHFVPYQYRPVLKLLRADRPRLLIADEVGVGKTIEAGLIIKELSARMDLSSILVICPKALVAERKWFAEMKRFDEHFVALDGPLLRHCVHETDLEGEWPTQYAKAILPFSLLDSNLLFGRPDRSNRNGPGLLALNPPPKFDLVIVDEAHHIRNSETFLHQTVRFFCDNAHAVLLLSATPVQLGSDDLFTLLNVLRPDLVIDQASFEQMAAPNRFINDAIQHCRAAQSQWQTEAANQLRQAAATQWGKRFLRGARAFETVAERLEKETLDPENRLAIIQSMEELYTFSPMINRTRRRDIGEFTTRTPETLSTEFTPEQWHVHDNVLHVIARILARCHGQQNVKFMMTTIRRQAASCLYGLAPFLADILSGQLDRLEQMEVTDSDQEDPDLEFINQIRGDIERLLTDVARLDPHDPKVAALINVLRQKGQCSNNKALVFSTFRHTLRYLNEHAQRAGLRVALIHGDVPDEERTELRRRFALPKDSDDAIDVLFSSEVACEGLDFQFCDLLVNYDIPWNPMRIEQRIGRIDRYGQQSEAVAIINMITPGTVDAEIYERCLWRIGVFQHSVGGNEEILGTVTKELHNIAETAGLSPVQRSERLQQLADNTIRQVREEQTLEEKQLDLFGLRVPGKSWREDIKSFESFWLSPAAIQHTVKTYLSSRLRSVADHLLGEKSVKTLRLSQEARTVLLEDYRSIRSHEPIAREWEKYLRGAHPTLSVTFNQEAAVEHSNATYLSVLHPLVRQAARFLEISEPKYCSLTASTDEIDAGVYTFALYRWTKHGVKADDLLVPVVSEPAVEASLLKLLQSASENTLADLPTAENCEALDVRHHSKWDEARALHVAENRRIVEHRVQSLIISHRARCSSIGDQIARASNDKIRLMKEGELARATTDFERRLSEMRVMASSADICAVPVVFGTLVAVKSARDV